MGLPTVPPYTTPEKYYRVFCFKSTVPQGGGYTWIPLWVTGATESQHAGSEMHLKHVSFSTRQILMGCTCLLGEMWNAAVLLSVNTVTPISQKSQLLWYIPRVSVSVGYLLSVAFQASSFFLGGCAPCPFFSLQRIKSQESLDSFLSFPPDIKIVPENFLLMLLYQHLFHLSILFHFHKLLLPHTWIPELHFPPIPVFSFSSKHSILLPDQFS